jgi:hypothetical protein
VKASWNKMEFIASNIVCKPHDMQRAVGADGVATDSAGPLDGLEVRMPASCGKCGCVIALIQTETNRRSLRCAFCGTPLGRVSDAAERFLLKLVQLFGRPTKPIEIHRNRNPELSPPPSGAVADDSHGIIAPEKAGK